MQNAKAFTKMLWCLSISLIAIAIAGFVNKPVELICCVNHFRCQYRVSHNRLPGCPGQPFLPVGQPKAEFWLHLSLHFWCRTTICFICVTCGNVSLAYHVRFMCVTCGIFAYHELIMCVLSV